MGPRPAQIESHVRASCVLSPPLPASSGGMAIMPPAVLASSAPLQAPAERGSRDCRDAPQATVSTAGSRSSLPASRLQPNDAAASGFARRADRSSDERRSAKQRSAALLIAASEARVRREQRPVCICRPTRSPPGLGRPRVRLPAVGMSPKALTRCARPEYEDRQTSSAPPDVCVLKLSSSGLPVPVRAKGAVAGSGGLPCLLLARA